MFLQNAFDFEAVNHQNSQYNERQDILQLNLCCQSVNMTKIFRVNLEFNYGGWGTVVEWSTIFHRIALLQAWILTLYMVIKITLNTPKK